MADEDLEQEEGAAPASKKGGGSMKLILISLFALVLLGGGAGAAYFLLGEPAEEAAAVDKTKKAKKAKKGKAVAAKTPKQEIFFPIEPPIVVNFTNPTRARFLQITMEVLVHSDAAVANIKKYMPIIRNNIVLNLSSVDANEMTSREGKEKVRADILNEMRAILKERTGEPSVEQVYFTGFVMQ